MRTAFVGRSGTQILIVDDDETFRTYAVDLLNRRGHTCFAATNIEQALNLVDEHAIDLVLIDLYLQEEHGLDLLRKLGERHSPVPALILTGQPSFDTAVLALRESVLDYVTKSSDDLATAVERALGKLESHRAANQTTVRELERQVNRMRRYLDEVAVGPAGSLSRGDSSPPVLSERELQIAQLAASGNSAAEIGTKLDLSPHTVRNHIKAVYGKLRVHSRTELQLKLSDGDFET